MFRVYGFGGLGLGVWGFGRLTNQNGFRAEGLNFAGGRRRGGLMERSSTSRTHKWFRRHHGAVGFWASVLHKGFGYEVFS